MSVTKNFLGLLSWYCSTADLTLDELTGHLALRLNESKQWKGFRYAMLINDPVQLVAEDALCAVVENLPESTRLVRRWSSIPKRNIDWAQTVLAKATGRYGEFCIQERIPIPDTQLLQALSNIATRWRRLLELDGTNAKHRIARLLEIENMLPKAPIPWSHALQRKLFRVNSDAALAIEAAIRQWDGEGNRGQALAEQFSSWLEDTHRGKNFEAVNADTLFEWSVALTISRAAVAARWRILPNRYLTREAKYGEILLEKAAYRLRISKGKPLDGTGIPITRNRVDRVSEASQQAGINASGLQPDIVLTFFTKDNPSKSVTFLADAKRNDENGGRGYLGTSIQKAAAYVYAYESWLPQPPRCTLFMRQGVFKVLGINVGSESVLKDIDNVIKAIETNDMPDILCIDQRMMIDDLIAPWLVRLEKNAIHILVRPI